MFAISKSKEYRCSWYYSYNFLTFKTISNQKLKIKKKHARSSTEESLHTSHAGWEVGVHIENL